MNIILPDQHPHNQPATTTMQTLNERINAALAKEEARAELFANNIRLILLSVLLVAGLLNSFLVAFEANLLNFGVLGLGFTYGIIVLIYIRRKGYKPLMKYFTSCMDILLIYLLLFMYAKIEIPSVALKNYVFLVVFPIIALTTFRYDRMLTLVTGGFAIALYVGLLIYLCLTHAVVISNGGHAQELFSSEVTYIGQSTKVIMLTGFVVLLSSLSNYSRNLFTKLTREELDVRNQKELMDWELQVASQVQTMFLPHSFPAVAGLEMFGAVQQGRSVGGDYVDFIKLAEDRLLVVCADVSGKGVPAALIMSEVRASTHLLASLQIGLEDFARRLNSLLHQSTDKKHFVTFFAAEIDATLHRLIYINAGHPPPMIFSGVGVRPLTDRTVPLGCCDVLPRLSMRTETFSPGDMMLSYTDGLLEQPNAEGDQFGDVRIREFIRDNSGLDPRTFTVQLLEEVKKFGGADLLDDISLAVVKQITS
jgi:serine phosphatase RsbU (regulator of sigma subunit)